MSLRVRLRAALVSFTLVPPILLIPTVPVQADPSPCASEAGTEAEARSLAVACATQVEVLDERTPYTQVFAQPDGVMVMESGVTPQRVQQPDGAWVPVDTTVVPNAAGRFEPVASLSNVNFSAGGDQVLARVVSKTGKVFELSWPSVLPAATATGPAVTYPEVYAGVDLVVEATDLGFTHTLVVKNAQAAANPALQTITYDIGGDTEVIEGKDGSLHAIADGEVVTSSRQAVMWDSATAPAAQAPQSSAFTGAGPDSVTAGDPAGSASNVTEVDVSVVDGELRLAPDQGLLTGPETVYPVFIDPSWSDDPAMWAYANSTNKDWTGDPKDALAWVGADYSGTYRSLFQFSVGALKDKQILGATFSITAWHTWVCPGQTSPVYFYRSKAITSGRVSWSTAALSEYLGWSDVDGINKLSCYTSATDSVELQDGNLKADLQDAADARWSNYTVAMSARAKDGSGETTESRWKKFKQGTAKLSVEYNSLPTVPTSVKISQPPATPDKGTACTGTVAVGGTTQVLSAIINDADADQKLTTYFEYTPLGGTAVTKTVTSVPAKTRATYALTGLADKAEYSWRVRAKDPYGKYSPWTTACIFTVDASRPAAPEVKSSDYPECTDLVCDPYGGPGTAGTFTVTSTDSDVKSIKYGWTSPPTSMIAATANTPVAIALSPPKYGENTLFVAAIDSVGNTSQTGSYSFRVGEPSAPVSGWDLEGPTGQGPNGLANVVTGSESLSTAGAFSWAPDAHLVGAETASFNNGGYAQTTAPLLDTTESFGAAGWVRLASKATSQNLVTQLGTHNNAFYFGYVQADDRWEVRFTSTDALSGYTWYSAKSTTVPQIDEWVHLAMSYDAASGQANLFVNGVSEATVTVGARYPTSGRVVVGAGVHRDVQGDFWRGQIARVRLYDRVLVTEDLAVGSAAAAALMQPTLNGSWNFDDFASYDQTEWYRDLTLSSTASIVTMPTGPVLKTVDGSGYAETNGPVLRTDQSFTVAAWGKIDAFGDYSTIVSQDGTVMGSFRLQYRAAQNQWCLTMRTANVDDAPVTLACQTEASTLDITHLIGVYDRAKNQIRLYVNGEPAATAAMSQTMWHATGSLAVGRSTDIDNPGGHQCDMFDGQVDDVRTWQGAFTDAQAAALYNAIAPATN